MSERITCEAFDAAAAELAFELVDPEARDVLLAHAAGCDRCRAELESLSVTADLLVLLAPDGEPPMGFEQRAVEAMVGQRRSRRWLMLAAAAAVLFVVGLGIGSWRSHDDSTSTFRQAVLVDDHGASFGSASLAWSDDVVLTMSLKGLDAGDYRCLVETSDGRTHLVATWPIGAEGTGWWAVPLQLDARSVHSVLIQDDDGTPVASAVFN
ncbi:MAG: hypothetical protein JWL72_4163 [Ilumatobacteraceae bacterium]|nr:hypothetical protein [Ilumatobacteraceae bacterium]